MTALALLLALAAWVVAGLAVAPLVGAWLRGSR